MSVISLEPEKERKIIEECSKDKAKFAPLYSHYKKYIFDFFIYRVSETETAEDLTARTFEKALSGIDNFQWQGISFSAWLYRIARNTLIDYYRANEKRKDSQNIQNITEVISKEKPILDQIEYMMSEELLYKAIKELPVKEKDIIYMKFFEGYTNRTISKITGLSETNVGTIIYRTVKKIRELYFS